MYDAREKASLDIQSNLIDARKEGRQEGRHEGRQQGEAIGRVKTYQELLGDRVALDEELSKMTLAELGAKVLELQERLRKRRV